MEASITHTSIEKVNAFIEYQAAEMGGDAMGQAALAMARPMLNLPTDPAVLDDQLAAWAQLCLAMRSDGAEPLHVAQADGTELPAPEE